MVYGGSCPIANRTDYINLPIGLTYRQNRQVHGRHYMNQFIMPPGYLVNFLKK